MHSNTILTALLLIFSATSASSHLNIYARDLPLRPRRYEGASDALQKIKTGVQDGIASVQNSKSAGGHNPVPPAVGAIAGFAEGVGAICSKTTGACKYEPPKTALQTKVGKNPAEMKAANALNAANTAKGFGETDPKKIEVSLILRRLGSMCVWVCFNEFFGREQRRSGRSRARCLRRAIKCRIS